MIYQIIVALLLLFPTDETSAPILLSNIQQTGEYVTSDGQGNFYIVNRNKVSRYNIAGKNSGDYSWGYNISSVDASDPSRILLFSKGDRVVKYLDGTMNQYTVDIKLDELGFDAPSVACSDNVDGFWIYDAQQDQIFQISSSLRIAASSYSLSAISGNTFMPMQMRLKNKQIFISDAYRGVMIFSNTAKYIKTLQLFGVTQFDVNARDEIGFYLNNKIEIYNIGSSTKREIPLNIGGYTSASCSLNSEPPMLFIMNSSGVKVYGF